MALCINMKEQCILAVISEYEQEVGIDACEGHKDFYEGGKYIKEDVK